jgi:hypothetical protein
MIREFNGYSSLAEAMEREMKEENVAKEERRRKIELLRKILKPILFPEIEQKCIKSRRTDFELS